MSFAELMKQVQTMNYSVIVFDTAPTGHTLRLLSFPSVLQKAFSKMSLLKEKFAGLFQQVQTMVNQKTEEKMMNKLESLKETIVQINKQFKDPTATTFVCVCIPEFLSLFETERLVQELTKFEIDTHNIVVNQVLYPEKESNCKKCHARVRMQRKYLEQIRDLYDTFNVTLMPLLDEEVRGVEALSGFGEMLLKGGPLPVVHDAPAAAGAGKPVAAAGAGAAAGVANNAAAGSSNKGQNANVD